MAEAKREISGFFLSNDKFTSHVAALSRPDCTTTQLRLFHNEPHHSAAVLHALRSNNSVTSFDIYEVDPASAGSLAAVLSDTPRLTTLAVHHLHGHEAVIRLAQGLSANRTLTHLHLSQLDARGVAAVADALSAWAIPAGTPALPHRDPAEPGAELRPTESPVRAPAPVRLQQLRLDKCGFTPDAAVALAAALGSQAGALVRVELVECDLGDAAAAALLAAPAWGALAAGGVLASLDLSSCRVGAQGAALLSRTLATSTSLTALSLANNRSFGCAGAAALHPGLAASRSLRRLDLSGCGVGATGVAALAAALRGEAAAAAAAGGGGGGGSEDLPAAPPLQHLTLSDNDGRAAGLLALLQSMSGPRPCALASLAMDRNHIRGAELAAPLPLVTAPLEQLSLAGNSLWDAGVTALAAALTAAPALEHLDLRENGVSDAGVAALLPLVAAPPPRRGSGGGGAAAAGAGGAVRAGPGLAGLLLDGNRLHNAGGQALLEAVTAAPGLWRFSAEANKLTDPALRLSLTQLGQLRAARHSQLVVLGRQLSSSSSSSSDDGDTRPGRRGGGGADRRSGGGAGGSAGGGGGDGGGRPMDVDSPRSGGGGGGGDADGGLDSGGSAGGEHGQHHQHHQHHQQLKHRLEERSDGGASSGDDRPPPRNVVARGAEPLGYAGGCGGGGGCGAWPAPAGVCSMGQSMAIDVPCGGGGPDVRSWRATASLPRATAYSDRGGSSGGASVDGCLSDSAQSYGYGNGGAAAGYGRGSGGGGGCPIAAVAAMLSSSPPPSVCVVTALTGVGGAGSVAVSKRAGGSATGGGCDHTVAAAASATPPCAKAAPQQLLPPSRRPRYKPLTPEQQRLFEDF